MANTIRIKRRAAGGATGAPPSLFAGELAFNETDSTLYVGVGTGGLGGTATTIPAIAGAGAFATLTTTQTISGNKTFSGTVSLGSSATATTQSTGDNSTYVATTAFVKAQNYLTANQSISINGDVTGTGTTSITVTIANGVVTNAKLANMAAATIKGRSSGSGTGVPEDLTGAQVKTILNIAASDVSGFDTQVRTNRLDQLVAPTANLDINNNRLTGVADPVGAQDAATKAYVDATRQGLDVKASVRVATLNNIVLIGTQTIDGVALNAGDRVLVRQQTTESQNGIYVVATGAWSRATDANLSANVTAGLFTFVSEGTQNADSGWVLTTNDAITLDSTALSFTQFSGAGMVLIDQASTANVTKGLEKDGNYLRLDVRLKRIADLPGVTVDTLIYASGTDTFSTTSFTTLGRSLAGASSQSNARTALGLGTIATQDANNVSITGGAISSVSLDLVTIDGGVF